ncbi:PBSX family phage terminase large subunit [Macrococcoides caseolyticum]|uniref:PBSX family phage terminase large subunit n=1 Tax=Macrococcoides caseolyticum TaxID=69966 RepID=UPI000C31BD14|nr:PBSX family phage terminase large subunit [Macrococcus caseolyticus]PKE52724.1 PBSX family phage terminase large subunit [Macrococcus caseolyticus]PKF38441.1 PBSX family phage terminase large subunit [Macrococcus caseolyticus]
MTSKKMSDLLPVSFHDVWRKAKDPNNLNVVCKGGRGSGKSSDIAIMLVTLIIKYPVNAVVIRKVDNTLVTSVYEQIKWAIEQQQVSHLFKVMKSPLEIQYIPRGNKIIFRGAQNPERLKSLKDSKFPYAIAWIEELAEFKTEDEVTTITNSLLRGELDDGLFYKFFFTYNPPKRKTSWVNKKYETVFQPPNTFVHHSTYLDNPYIAQAFKDEAEAQRIKNEKRYRWEYLGEAIGSGVVPFDNLEFREIPDKEYNTFDNFRQGVDYGYATDPLAFVRWHYDKKRNTIYAMEEIYGVKMSNKKLSENMYKIKAEEHHTISEVSPKDIDELKFEHGIYNIKQAKKGPGSVEYGEKWLDDLDAIVIDPKRTPNIAREFENIDYETDRDGNPKARLVDVDNHTIDATRYAFENDMKKRRGTGFGRSD